MKLFLDSANLDEINWFKQHGLIDGVTTNPSLLKKEVVVNVWNHIKLILNEMDNMPVSIQLMADNPKELFKQAYEINSFSENVVVKIPVLLPNGNPCFDIINRLTKEGIKVNVTCCTSFGQGLLAAKSGAEYVSLLYGRINDSGQNGDKTINEVVQAIKAVNSGSKVLVASIRTVADIRAVTHEGADVITIPPEILRKLYDHEYSKRLAEQFMEDSKIFIKN